MNTDRFYNENFRVHYRRFGVEVRNVHYLFAKWKKIKMKKRGKENGKIRKDRSLVRNICANKSPKPRPQYVDTHIQQRWVSKMNFAEDSVPIHKVHWPQFENQAFVFHVSKFWIDFNHFWAGKWDISRTPRSNAYWLYVHKKLLSDVRNYGKRYSLIVSNWMIDERILKNENERQLDVIS